MLEGVLVRTCLHGRFARVFIFDVAAQAASFRHCVVKCGLFIELLCKAGMLGGKKLGSLLGNGYTCNNLIITSNLRC
jgi:hypothetical protein